MSQQRKPPQLFLEEDQMVGMGPVLSISLTFSI